jgi:hypothetical protein
MRVIVSMVVFVSLEGFGAIDVVQSFQPVRPVAMTSVAGFGRLVNDANTAYTSPKSFIPRSVYCNGGKVPCIAAMGRCAAATAARGNAHSTNDDYHVASVRGSTILSASTSPEDDAKPLDSVWVQLYVDGEEVGYPTYLEFTKQSKRFVSSLARLVKKVYSDDLVGISAPNLKVYKSGADPFAPMLDTGEIVTEAFGGTTSKCPIRVMALTPNTARMPNQGMLFIIRTAV